MRLLPFDAHNHIHLGPPEAARALLLHPPTRSAQETSASFPLILGGMAVMSTHPRDYPRVLELSQLQPHMCTQDSSNDALLHVIPVVVPCFGIHPWFVHELTADDWESSSSQQHQHHQDKNDANNGSSSRHHHHHIDFESSSCTPPHWYTELEHNWLELHPHSIVGEIGLDGHRYDPDTGALLTPMERQVDVFQRQMQLAARLDRPVSVHCVQSWGPLMKVLSVLSSSGSSDTSTSTSTSSSGNTTNKNNKHNANSLLPPAIYFHAFGGKAGTVRQLQALCARHATTLYFGFAPVVNFRSPKTAHVIRTVGLGHLVLETDHEDASRVVESMAQGISFVAEALGTSKAHVVEQTTRNAMDLYRL